MGIREVGNWGVRRPLAFSVVFCIPLAVLFLTIASVFGEILRHRFSLGYYVGLSAGLVLGALCFLYLLRRFDWVQVSGVCRPPSKIWLVIVPPLLYIVTANFYVSSRTFDLDFSEPTRSALVSLRMMSTGLFEEVVFRGAILTAMILAWGTGRIGLLKSVVISSFLFGALHLLNLTTSSVPAKVFANSIYTCFTGVLFGGVVIRCKSIWPAVLLHGSANALLSLNRMGETPPNWTIPYAAERIAVHIPLALYGLYLIRERATDGSDPDAA